MNQQELAELNPHIRIKSPYDDDFIKYGRLIEDYNFNEIIQYMEQNTSIPGNGNTYLASVPEMENTKIKDRLQSEFYGEMPIEIGYCNGPNSTLNGLEYHMGSEIDVAVTDLVLFLGQLRDIQDNKYSSSKVEAFFIKKGTAVQIYETTLHFGPCKTSEEGFKCIVVLPRGTNEPLKNNKSRYKDKLLFARNKWLLVHGDKKNLIENGAYAGIDGENIEIKIK
ncbi:DUF4867 family protein [Clostridium sp. LBM24168]